MTVVASFLPVVTATPPSTRKYDANSKPISSLSDKFTLTVLTPDSKGKINLKVSNPVILKSYWLFSEVLVSLPRVGLANLGAQTFSLKNKKLSAEGSEASLLPVKYEISFLGLRSFLFDPDERAGPYDSINFTAVHTTDSYGRRFLRLGAGDGEFLSENHVIGSKHLLLHFTMRRPLLYLHTNTSFFFSHQARINSSSVEPPVCKFFTSQTLMKVIVSSVFFVFLSFFFWNKYILGLGGAAARGASFKETTKLTPLVF